MNKDILFAKQPIYDVNNSLFGYEILYRDSENNFAAIDDGTQATINTLINYCSGVVEEQSSPYAKIFINLTKELLLSECFFPLPPDRIIIEILEDIEVDEDFLVRLSELKSCGYSFALDDYTLAPQFDVVLPLVYYIKVDVLGVSELKIALMYKKILEQLGLSQKVIEAITHYAGPLGNILKQVIEIEKGDLTALNGALSISEKRKCPMLALRLPAG